MDGKESAFTHGDFSGHTPQMGLTKREWMATQALVALLTKNEYNAVSLAVRAADDLIAELNKA